MKGLVEALNALTVQLRRYNDAHEPQPQRVLGIARSKASYGVATYSSERAGDRKLDRLLRKADEAAGLKGKAAGGKPRVESLGPVH